MLTDLRQLVADVATHTGAAPPPLLDEQAPVLVPDALQAGAAGLYLVGLIGGKDVGKSSLVNALVGQSITDISGFGAGTDVVFAYAHESQRAALQRLLDAQVPGQYRIVEHHNDELARQVLLDLPDIDSHYAAHIQITRRMLRHMLYPIWIQSVEKYADQRPQQLLAQVADGNTPANFIFCLNKVDQVFAREGEQGARELGADYAQRIARVLGLPQPPRVWLISAVRPDEHDLPELRRMLGRQRPAQAVSLAMRQAAGWQGKSLLDWVEAQRLEQRLAALERLERTAQEEATARIGAALCDHLIPALAEDPAGRLALADELMNQRVARWPVVNVLHVVLGPLLSALRRRLPVEQQRGLEGADEMVAVNLEAMASRGGQPLASLVQSTFAVLQQSSPLAGAVYAQRKLWEAPEAEAAVADLRRRLAATIERQRAELRRRFGSSSVAGGLMRLILTFGAIAWFPFIQPLLEAWLTPGHGQMALLLVQMMGVGYLLKNVGFLAVWFTALWLVLKWSSQRRVDRWLGRCVRGEGSEAELSLTAQAMGWMQDLLEPIAAARRRIESLIQRRDQLRAAVQAARAA